MRSRIGLIIAGIVVGVSIAVMVAGLRSARQEPHIAEPPDAQIEEANGPEQPATELQDLTVEGAQVTQKDAQGNIIWQLATAGEFDYDRASQTLRAEAVRCELMRQDEETLIVEAPKFVASYRERVLKFSQGVRAYAADRSQLFQMPEAVYQLDTRKLIAIGAVRFRYGQYEATARRLVVDSRAAQVRMSGGVRFARKLRG